MGYEWIKYDNRFTKKKNGYLSSISLGVSFMLYTCKYTNMFD